jgi:hypothetical protein
MSYVSFAEISRKFEEQLSDDRVYRSTKHSFLKVFQHGLSYAMNGWTRMLLPNKLQWPSLLLWVFYVAKWLNGKRVNRDFNDVVILESGRAFTTAEKQKVSMYFSKLPNVLSAQKRTIILLSEKKEVPFDYWMSDLKGIEAFPDRKVMSMLGEVKEVLAQLQGSNSFSENEKVFIQSSLHTFMESFKFYYALFKGTKVRKVAFIAHYHNEGLMAACEALGIESIEFQHGLIAKNDLYYCYNSKFAAGVKAAFFPNKIMLYGQYWKNTLLRGCEWREEQLVILGDYLANARPAELEKVQKENIILIGSQKNIEEDYVKYLQALMQLDLTGWKVVVKLHPLEEKVERYHSIVQPDYSVAPMDASLIDLLQVAKIQISIYSTTLYDALGYDVVNFSIQDLSYMQHYAQEMIDGGVALPIRIGENPVELFEKLESKKNIEREVVYARLDEKLLAEMLR